MKIEHHIGEYYKYPWSNSVFKLVEVRKWVYHFECGFHCMDTCFMDMIRIKTGVQVYVGMQMEMFKR